jgi:hypothetical protein
MMALCPDCEGEGRTLVTYAALRAERGRLPRVIETVALRECAVCEGAGWYDPTHGR